MTFKKVQIEAFNDLNIDIPEFDIIPRLAIARGEKFVGILIAWGHWGISIAFAKKGYKF